MIDEVDVTVAVCTLNRREALLQTLDTVAAQQAAGSWELLVVDNGSEDGTAQAVGARTGAFPGPARLIVEPRRGLSVARNRALEEARGRAVVFIDDDVNCLDRWLAGHLAAFAASDVVATGGRILPVLPAQAPEWWGEILPHEIGGPTSRYDFGLEPAEIIPGGPVPPPFGANMGVLRQLALDVGGFREDLGWGGRMIPSEEYEFYRRVLAAEGRALYVPGATVEHRIDAKRVTREYYVAWQRSYGRATAIIDPPANILRLTLDLASCVKRFLATSASVLHARLVGKAAKEMRKLRRRERARGRCYELLGIRSNG